MTDAGNNGADPESLDSASIDPEGLAQPYAERLAEDESLRGELTDSGFGPLLDWLTNLLIDAAGRIAKQPNPKSVMDQAGDLARQLGQAIVAAARHGDRAQVSGVLAEPLFTREQVAAASAVLRRSLSKEASPDDRARLIVTALSNATGVGTGVGEEEEPT